MSWDWTLTTDRQNAYSAITGKGATADFKASVWNEIADEIKADATAWNGGSEWANIDAAYMTDADKTMTATRFNTAVKYVPRLKPFGWEETLGRMWIYSKDICYGAYFLYLTEAINYWVSKVANPFSVSINMDAVMQILMECTSSDHIIYSDNFLLTDRYAVQNDEANHIAYSDKFLSTFGIKLRNDDADHIVYFDDEALSLHASMTCSVYDNIVVLLSSLFGMSVGMQNADSFVLGSAASGITIIPSGRLTLPSVRNINAIQSVAVRPHGALYTMHTDAMDAKPIGIVIGSSGTATKYQSKQMIPSEQNISVNTRASAEAGQRVALGNSYVSEVISISAESVKIASLTLNSAYDSESITESSALDKVVPLYFSNAESTFTDVPNGTVALAEPKPLGSGSDAEKIIAIASTMAGGLLFDMKDDYQLGIAVNVVFNDESKWLKPVQDGDNLTIYQTHDNVKELPDGLYVDYPWITAELDEDTLTIYQAHRVFPTDDDAEIETRV